MAYSQLMRYQLYEQNICVSIFIRTKLIMPFPFIKSAITLTKRRNKIYNMMRISRIFSFENFTALKTYEKDQLKVTSMDIGLSESL